MSPLPHRTPTRRPRPQAPQRREQLIAALVPPALNTRPAPTTAPLPPLPAPIATTPSLRHPLAPEAVLLGMARLDRSGRLRERALLTALGWRPGHRVALDAQHGGIFIAAEPAGAHRIDARGTLSLPSAPRQMCGIPAPASVVLMAAVDEQVLVVYPAELMAHLLLTHRAAQTNGGR